MWPWRTSVGPARAPTVAASTGRPLCMRAGHVDVARLEPALHEAGGGLDALERGRVVGDQPLGQVSLVHGIPRFREPVSTLPSRRLLEVEVALHRRGRCRRSPRACSARLDQARALGLRAALAGCRAPRREARRRPRRRRPCVDLVAQLSRAASRTPAGPC